MGWGTLPAPGTKLGPCAAECKHIDCAQTRRDATAECGKCDRPIGYDEPLYRIDGKLYHAYCIEIDNGGDDE